MGAIGDESLHETGEGVEDGGGLLVVHAVSVADLFGDASHSEDGDGIIGRTDIHQCHQRADAEFCATLAVNMSGHPFDDEIDAALLFDEFQHTARHHGDDDEFPHADNAVAHGLHPSEDIKGTCQQTDDTRQDDTQCQDCHHVHTEDGGDENDEIGDDLRPFHVVDLLRCMDF